MTGIYLIRCKVNGKVYIGQSIYIENRIKSHYSRYYNPDRESGSLLHADMRKFGADNFEWKVLKRCKAVDLDYYEMHYISIYNSNNLELGYNQTLGGQGSAGSGKIPDRIIDEIYELLKNSILSQWDIGLKYGISQRMISMINTGELYAKENYSYPVRDFSILGGKDDSDVNRLRKRREDELRVNFCINCGVKIGYNSVMCVACRNKSKILPRSFSNKDVLELLKGNSFRSTARQLGLSQTSFLKYCKRNNLPSNMNELLAYRESLTICASSSDG